MWASCEPFGSPTVKRMLTVAHGTFCLLDLSDATVRALATGAGTFDTAEFLMRFNIAGIGRFTISLYGEGKRAIALHSAKEQSQFTLREKAIVEDYLNDLDRLARLYDDENLVSFVDSFKTSDAYIRAFEASARLAELRGVSENEAARQQSGNRRVFRGETRMKKETSLDKSRKMAEAALEETNAKIEELGLRSSRLYDALGAMTR